MKLFEMCEHSWRQAGLDIRLRLYACTSTACSSGVIQVMFGEVVCVRSGR